MNISAINHPRFPANHTSSSHITVGLVASIFPQLGVPDEWGEPTRIVAWDDENDHFSGAVAAYANGCWAAVRYLLGAWRLKTGAAA